MGGHRSQWSCKRLYNDKGVDGFVIRKWDGIHWHGSGRKLNRIEHIETLMEGIDGLIQRHGLKPDIFVDVGAYKAWWSRAANRLGYFNEIHAIEPNHTLELRKKFDENHPIKVHTYAVGDKTEKVKFYFDSENGRIGTLDSDRRLYRRVTIEVRKRTIDSFNFKGDCFFKIDVEDHEVPTLVGARETLTNNNCIVLIEISKDPIISFDLMKSYGYEVCGYMFAEVMYPLDEDVLFTKNCNGLDIWTTPSGMILDYDVMVDDSKKQKAAKAGYDLTKENPLWADFIFKKVK